jgi:DegV family protein with EDD domain
VDREGRLPTTSAPSPGQFAEAYEDAFASGAQSAVCFCVSGAVSATYGAAVIARDLFPERDITVVDTQTLSMAQGFMVLAAAEAGQAGASREQITAQAEDVGRRSHVYAALSTVKYLAMSGRVGHLAAGMATVLNVKPILMVREAKLDLLERIRTKRKAWARVIELTVKALQERPPEQLAVLHVAVPEEAVEFRNQLCQHLRCPEQVIMAELTPGLSVHSGAGLVGAVAVAAP